MSKYYNLDLNIPRTRYTFYLSASWCTYDLAFGAMLELPPFTGFRLRLGPLGLSLGLYRD